MRRKEEKLRRLKAKIEIYEKSGDDKTGALLRDVQVEYDKYLKIHGAEMAAKSSLKGRGKS